ncbi:L,D-transpeptidase [Mesorhizobium sp. SP-1A]|uniref:L,D-transpeptidase n=1 Tax=Mesorhizobium sp. SP-1A TaxID=3077840 RepID=UPI0028F6E189|nr:L,D-transpeptidase family protein [Mesorhizobium sp. SP-1A]
MQLRSFILAGLCAALSLGAPAYAAMPVTQTPEGAGTNVVQVAAKSPAVELRQLKRKKKPTSEDLARIKELEKQVEAERAAAYAKMIEAKKAAMREAAKARAQAEREAFLAKRNRKPAPEAVQEKTVVSARKPAVPVKPVEQEEAIPAEAMNVALTGNNGELRSGTVESRTSGGGLFGGLFGGTSTSSIAYLPETRALDSALRKKDEKRPFKVKPEFVPQDVPFSGYEPGTIVINTQERRLYLVETPFTARRYAIAVGKEGLQFKGETTVGDKQEWPRWIPTKEMQEREPKHYGRYKDGMPGGGENPLGARAIYLYQGKKDTHLRIHGTIAPQTIGTSASNGCFRMINEHVMDLYNRVSPGTKVVIL